MFSQALTWTLTKFQYFTGISDAWTPVIFWLIFGYLVLFFLIIPIHRGLKKKKIRLQKILVESVDEMIYLLANAQHIQQIDLKSLGGSPNVALMKSIFTKGKYDYIQSSFLILDNMHKVESLLGKKVVPTEKEVIFMKNLKKYHRIGFFEALFKAIITIATLGIYALVG